MPDTNLIQFKTKELLNFILVAMATELQAKRYVAGARSKFWGGGGRIGGLHMCHPPYHPLDFQSKLNIFVTLPSSNQI